MKSIKIGILKHDKLGYGEEVLVRLLMEKGHDVSVIDPRNIVFDLNTRFPEVIVARCELASFSEEVFTSYLVYLYECEIRKVFVINPKEFLLCGQNKYLTHLVLKKELQLMNMKDVFNPRTYLVNDKQKALDIGSKEIRSFGSVVIKHPASGHGEGVFLSEDVSHLDVILKEKFIKGQAIILQQTIEKEKGEHGGYRDIRLWVCKDGYTGSNKVIAGYYRNAPVGQFVTNLSFNKLGTRSKLNIAVLPQEVITCAEISLRATGGDVAGVDFARDINGNYWFEEINIAFETEKEALDIAGEEIWHNVVELVESINW